MKDYLLIRRQIKKIKSLARSFQLRKLKNAHFIFIMQIPKQKKFFNVFSFFFSRPLSFSCTLMLSLFFLIILTTLLSPTLVVTYFHPNPATIKALIWQTISGFYVGIHNGCISWGDEMLENPLNFSGVARSLATPLLPPTTFKNVALFSKKSRLPPKRFFNNTC